MWTMIQRSEYGPFPANADERVEALGVGDDRPRDVALRWNRSMSSIARAGSRSLKSASRSSSVEIGAR